ncbi:uracil-DNA glycosylase [Methylosinus sp. C49]|uniref:uracil-DNA glycosylase n=1 Tax=Methylosinus sp. C49 TaxID=2699395 RepID=UPI00136724EC|nr:uracil-DNA glycosylase [Methylosinus sp. C49]BBU61309.1 uracil-DNA glycosylase [Methylosinus sp. C49]
MSADADLCLETGLAALVDWYVSIGVDIAIDETPHDRFVESAAPPPARAIAPAPVAASSPSPARRAEPPARETRSQRSAAPVFTEEAARGAREAAGAARTIEELQERLAGFDGCALKATAGHFLFSAGAPGAALMVLDFSPGEEEERGGEAFVGPEARLLDNMLRALRRDRSGAYLAYATPWRPPGARELNPAEVAALNPFLRRHVELAAPRALLILGDFAARAALGSPDVARYRNAWFDYDCGGGTVRALLAPSLASLLRTPAMKRRAWRDLRAVAAALG